MNWLDIVLGAILLFSGIAALRNGLTREIVRIVALVVGVMGALWFYDALALELTFITNPAVATLLLVGLVAFVPIAGVDRAVAESNLAPLVLHGARAATYVAPAALRQAYSDNFEKVREVWSLRPETAAREAAADSAKPGPLR